MMEVEGTVGGGGAGAAVGGPVELLPPNHTLYIQNISEKIKEPELKKKLKALFAAYGPIVQIVAMKSYSRRGQAFVVFDSVEVATSALELQSHELTEGKPMRINFARTKSDSIAKREGTYAPRPKRALPPKPTPPGGESESLKRSRDDAADGEPEASRMRMDPTGPPPMPPAGYNGGPPQGYGAPPEPHAAMPPQAPPTAEVPNKILFLTELPADVTEMMLRMLFEQFPGFKEVRLIPGRHDIAFVEYGNEAEAYEARAKLHGFQIKPDAPLSVSFAKK